MRAVVVALSLVTSVLTVVPAAARSSSIGQPHGDAIQWGACPFDVGASHAQCGTVRVPLDYRRPDGPASRFTCRGCVAAHTGAGPW
jgi:hypothetical protein